MQLCHFMLFTLLAIACRPPFGYHNRAAVRLLEELGFRYIAMWNIDSKDWQDGEGIGLLSRIKNRYEDAPLYHNHIALHHEWVKATVNRMVPFIIEWAQRRNLRMVTLGECIGDPPENWYTGQIKEGIRDSTWICPLNI